ncbi:hypothetical protein HI145_RS00065 [Escherichia coli]|nr:hypothetical protein [Escherichia coli]ELW0836648.1 hypothetical protein [Escherichia coli]
MSDYVAFLHRFGEAQEKHIIRMPAYGEEDWYKSTISVGAFRDREAEFFLGKQHEREVLCSLWRLDEWDSENSRTAESMMAIVGIANYQHPYDLLPTFEHASLFDFYKAVGYDYKKKRYI